MYGTGKRGKKAERNNTKMSETYEIIVLDLDGTLTNSKKVITPKTKDALMRIQKEGKKVVLASGRPTGHRKAGRRTGFEELWRICTGI